jgi:hypothetical protein
MDGACEATRNRPQLRCRRFYALAVSGEYPPIKYGSERSANAPGGKPKTDAYPAIENAARGTLQGQRDLMFYPDGRLLEDAALRRLFVHGAWHPRGLQTDHWAPFRGLWDA